MTRSIGAGRLAGLVRGFSTTPAYAGLAESLTILIGDGRIPLDTRLPSERDLCEALGVSRTTVTRAYAALRESGYADARQGAGTFARVPGGPTLATDRALMPRAADAGAIDLNCAAASAPPGIAQAYAEAVSELPAYLGGHGYFPAGLPRLQQAIAATYDARGLPTRPDQILVTSGALAAAAIVAQALTSAGDRVMVESPVYPNAVDALRRAGARLAPSAVDPDGWDLDAVAATLGEVRPRLAYLIPDFQNPTGLVMPADQRERYARLLRAAGTTAIVDEAHQALELDGGEMPPPFASFSRAAITVGSASKAFWGGLRLGWVRMPEGLAERVTRARVSLDLGAPVLEQLVLCRLLESPRAVLDAHRDRLREQRAALVSAVGRRLPEWRFRTPSGGLALWCELPEAAATEVTTVAERAGVIVAPGPTFAVEGGLNRYVRIPWTRPVAELEEAVAGLARAWDVVRDRRPRHHRRAGRVMVA